MQLDQDLINEIREKNDILDVVSQYVKLEKGDVTISVYVPFMMKRRHPFQYQSISKSVIASAAKKGGNVFQFMEQIENISFVEAVRRLGENVGVQIAQREPVVYANDNMKMIEMHELLRDYYHYVLKAIEEAEPALQYLYDRGFTDEIINREKIGYSPNISHFAHDFLEKRGFDKALAYEAGLLSRNEENFSYYDRFRDRIMFPINNAQGHTVGFSGRTYKNEEPKYLNSPETPVFQKRQLLYHLDVARKAIRQQDEVILLEGFMDVIKVTEAGLTNTIATMGTALSKEHVLQLKKLAGNVTLMFDGDTAGQKATMSVGENLLNEGISTFVVPVKKDRDPDEMINDMGKEAFLSYVMHNKLSFVSYKLKEMSKQVASNDLVFDQRLKEVTNDIARIKSPALRKKVLHEASELFKVDFDSLNFEVSKYIPQSAPQFTPGPRIVTYSKPERAERLVLKHFFKDKYLFNKMTGYITAEHFKKQEHQEIFIALTGYYESSDYFNVSQFLSFVPAHCQSDIISIDEIIINQDPSVEEIEDYIYVIRHEQEELRSLSHLKQSLSEAIAESNEAERDRLMKAIIDYNRQKKLK